MCFKKKVYIKPLHEDSDIIVQFSDPFLVTKKTYVTVPENYMAFVYENGARTVRLEDGKDNCLFKMNKKNKGKELQIEYILSGVKLQIPWGFGGISACDSETDSTFHVGANGQCFVDIDPLRLTQTFAVNEQITTDRVHERYIAVMRDVGVGILSDFFGSKPVSVLDVNTLTHDLQEKMLFSLRDHQSLVDIGLHVTNLTVAGIHVNTDDFARIQQARNQK